MGRWEENEKGGWVKRLCTKVGSRVRHGKDITRKTQLHRTILRPIVSHLSLFKMVAIAPPHPRPPKIAKTRIEKIYFLNYSPHSGILGI